MVDIQTFKFKICSKCKQKKNIDDFYYYTKKGKQSYCKDCVAEYYKEHREEYLEKFKKRRDGRRQKCLDYYGRKCACCGETREEFLSIDHINGNGNLHRKQINRASMYYWLIKNHFPKEFRILCHNCNQARGIYGYCPHEKERPY